MEKTDRDEIYNILNELGLDEEEISSINRRNRLLEETTSEEVEDIINFFKIKCRIDSEDIASIIIKNPLILNESFSRINLLSEIYRKVGFSEDEYRKYISSFEKAFSLNPREVLDNISDMLKNGKEMEDIKKAMLEKSAQIFL